MDPSVEFRLAPAAPGALAYVLDGDIYVADPDGSNAFRIATPPLRMGRGLGGGVDVVAGRRELIVEPTSRR